MTAVEKELRKIMKASKSRGHYDSSDKTYMLNMAEFKMLRTEYRDEFPVMIGKRSIGLDEQLERLTSVFIKTKAERDALEAEHKAEELDNTPPPVKPDAPVEPQQTEDPPANDEEQPETDVYMKEGTDAMIWVGVSTYPTIASFINDVSKVGVIRSFRKEPKGFLAGTTRMIFAHDEGFTGHGVVFGYCTPRMMPGQITDEDPPKRKDGQTLDDPNRVYAVGDLILTDGFIDVSGFPRKKGFPYVDGDAILGVTDYVSAPSAREGIEPVEKQKPKRWTDEERSKLTSMVNDADGVYPAFRAFSADTGRSLRSIEYQWYHTINKAE